MAGVLADQGHIQRHDAAPPPASTSVQHLTVTPENVLALARTFHDVVKTLQTATQNLSADLMLPKDAFLGDPHSKWAVEEFNEYFALGELSFANVATKLIHEHQQTFNALKAAADSYGKTDEWNARKLGDVYESP
jgi:uncharacterized protein YukE